MTAVATGAATFEIKGLNYTYPDGTVALSGLCLTAWQGQVVGLLGRNGSGKSTLLRLLATVLRPTAGTLFLFPTESPASLAERRRRIASVFEISPTLGCLSGSENAQRLTELRGVEGTRAATRVEPWFRRFGVSERASRAVFSYSLGMRRKAALAEAFAAEPSLFILDEPLIGLDLLARQTLAEGLRGAAARGATVVTALHDADFAADACNRVVLLDQGRIVADGSPDELVAGLGRETVFEVETGTQVRLEEPPDPLRALGSDRDTLRFASPDGSASLPALAAWLTERGVRVRSVRIREPKLEDVYLSLTGSSLEGSGRGSGTWSPGGDRVI